MKHVLVLLVASYLSACTLNEREVVIIIQTNNDLSTSVLGESSVKETAKELDLQIVFGARNETITCWSNRIISSEEQEDREWVEFQHEVQRELADRFGVSLRPELGQADFTEELMKTLETAGFTQQLSGGESHSMSTRDQEAGVENQFNKQDWNRKTSIYNR